ncbi:phage tail tube protein [Rhodomicrobium lacus]|uniref:phage tail tube protein n=1 Tax=Rhodomicrobium lacus TaxID=2498452 RepID=UPI000F8D8A19|nr:hypothetical protein [Rhodomicrobium lacus]
MPGTAVKNAGLKLLISAAPGGAATVLVDGVNDLSGFGLPTRKEIDVTALSDTWRRRIKGLKDGGQITISGQFRPSDPGQRLLAGAVNSDSAFGFRVELADSKGTNNSSFSFFAQVLSYAPASSKVDDVIPFKATISVDGPTQFTAAA